MTIIIRKSQYKAMKFCAFQATGLPTKDETSETTLWNLYYYLIFITPCY